jgi:glutaminyl-peptide cyclotransferase
MQKYGWQVELSHFEDQTPFGMKKFANIIANYPIGSMVNAAVDAGLEANQEFHVNNRVVFACHYDSKFFKDFDFIGAFDSAVPCAMLIDLAKFLHENFNTNQFNRVSFHFFFLF